jgi:two-component system response regulator DevR
MGAAVTEASDDPSLKSSRPAYAQQLTVNRRSILRRFPPVTDPARRADREEAFAGTGPERYEDHMIRVFLLDDHEVVRRGLADLLQAAGDIEVVGESGSAQEATRRIPALRPDVAVLDGRLPDGSGIDVCREVRAVDSSIKGLILTSYEDDEALFAAIMAGAAGYVLKQIRGTDLVDAIRRVAAGQSLLDPAVTQRVLERIRNGVEQPRELAELTDREREILELVAEGLTNRDIAGRLFLAEKTVKNYVSSLLAKLGLERRTQAAVLATRLLGDHPHQNR